MDFSQTLIRCSSLAKIMSEPQEGRAISPTQLERITELQQKGITKPLTQKQSQELTLLITKRDNPQEPELSLVCKTELVDSYLKERFNRRSVNKDKMIKFTEKGKMVEQDSIDLLSMLDNRIYHKNGERINNRWISGEVDIFEGEEIISATKVIDIKSSWDFESFMLNILAPLNKTYWWQMQGYLALTGARIGEICYCLVNTPQPLINDEKRRLFYSMGVPTEESLEYTMKADLLEYNMKYDDIDPRLRVMRFKVEADDQAIAKVYERVEKCRRWLTEISKIHDNLSIFTVNI